MADELIVQLEHPETGEYTYPKTLSKGVIIKEGKTLDDFMSYINTTTKNSNIVYSN